MDQGFASQDVLTIEDVRAAAGRIAGHVLRTPTLPSAVLTRITGADVYLKLDNLQAVGSFKERGAANRLALLTPDERARGVVAMSAGNHAQGVARHASRQGVAATIVMPRHTPLAKVSGTAAWGATVVLHGSTIANAIQLPIAAILPSEDGGTSVLVVGADGTAKKRAVQVGLRTKESAQILSGVTPADMVVVEGGYGLDDGTKVKVGAPEKGDGDAGGGQAS